MTSAIEDHLEALDGGALAALLLKRAGFDEDFRLWLESELAALGSRRARTPLDPELFRQRAEALLEAADSEWCRGRKRRWDEWGEGFDDAALEDMIGQAEPFLAMGDGANALAILKPIAEVLVDYWPEHAHWDETLHEYFPMLDRMIAHAVLTDGISPEARDDLADDLGDWRDVVGEYGCDDAFSIAIAACTQGWDEPGLEDVLAGRGRVWPLAGKGDWLEDGLTAVRLTVLEALGRTDHFLNLSTAAGLHCDHAMMLAKTGRFDDALAVARSRLRDPGGVLRLAELLFEKNQRDMAFDLGAWGLSLPAEKKRIGDAYDRCGLARWLRNEAQAGGRQDLAVTAARAAFEESLSREDFRAAQTAAGPAGWPGMRTVLLQHLMAADYARDRLDILLDEDLLDDAVTTAERNRDRFLSPHDATLMRLAEAACTRRPDWVIRFAFDMASPIMEGGQSDFYDLAVRWLEKAARSYVAAGKGDQWRVRLDALIETHRRKYKLRALLEALRKAD